MVLLGGGGVYQPTNSVQMMDISTESSSIPQWRKGPPMNRPRRDFDAVVCNGAVYAIGGHHTTIERIYINDLLKQHITSMPGTKTQSWCNLKCRLSAPTSGAGSTAVVQDRYIAVMPYQHPHGMIQVLDTLYPDNHAFATIDAPSGAHVPRWGGFTTVGVENKVYILGGQKMDGSKDIIKSVECIEFAWNDSANDQIEPVSGTESSCFEFRPKVLSWKVETDIGLLHARYMHSSVVVGSKIVVAGGYTDKSKDEKCVEVIDVESREVSELPEMNQANIGGKFLLALPDMGSLLAIGSIFNGQVIESLHFGGDLGNLEARHRTSRKVRRPENEIRFLRSVGVEEYLSHVAKFLSFQNMQVLSTKKDFIRNQASF